jgi:choline dehydrogenase-like flavoprotein
MFKDLRYISSESTLTYDICIVGTGPAGISVAKQLLGTGHRIVMLESGGELPESKYQQLNKGENSGPSFLSLDASRLRCFGGASKLWAGYCSPFKSDEFDKKSFIPLSGWPISLDDLKIYYKQAAKMLGISYKKFYSKDYFQNTFDGISFKEFDRDNSFLSGNVFQVSNAKNRDFGEKYKTDFKSSVNTDVIFHSTVTELNLNSTGRDVQSVLIADLDGNKATIKAKIFVLACGALENPRILLASNKHYKNGIGNINGFVGSCFMSHPGVSNVGEIHKTSLEECISKDKYDDSYIVRFEMSSRERSKQKVLRHLLSISQYRDLTNPRTYISGRVFSEFDKLVDNFNFVSSVKKTACRINGEYSSKLWNLTVALEQPPRLSNNLRLHASHDDLGMPKINMYWDDISKIERDTVIKSVKTMARELGITNIGRIKFKSELLTGKSYKINDPVNHHIGTTRMSNDSETGVVDKNCKVFGISNLYVAGSSAFATSSVVNPTYTIIAMSLKLGEYLKNIKI